jgi:hypothetical protein
MSGPANGPMKSWANLADELALWQAAGRTVELWWRDDDAVSDTPALRRLIEIAQVPVALAVIPAELQPSLATCLTTQANAAHLTVLQHGFSHRNYEPAGRKKAELGEARLAALVLAELAEGQTILQRAFGGRVVPVLTPPWNRIAPGIVGRLPALGFAGLTTYLPRPARLAAAGLLQVNTHVDIIDWHGGRGFLGTDESLALLIRHLQARRHGQADDAEPTGILTHHLVHDAASWDFLARLQDWLSTYPMIRWLTAQEVFLRGLTKIPPGEALPPRML